MRDLTVQKRPMQALMPYCRPRRRPSAGHMAQIAASSREFGRTKPVLVEARTASWPGQAATRAQPDQDFEAVAAASSGEHGGD